MVLQLKSKIFVYQPSPSFHENDLELRFYKHFTGSEPKWLKSFFLKNSRESNTITVIKTKSAITVVPFNDSNKSQIKLGTSVNLRLTIKFLLSSLSPDINGNFSINWDRERP